MAVRDGYTVIRTAGRYFVFARTPAAEMAGRLGPCDGLVEIWNGMPFLSPLWWRGPTAVWLHHVHGPMWDQTLPAPAARVGNLLEERLAPPFYRRTPIVTLSQSSKEELVDDLGFDRDHVTVVPPGVDPFFSPGGEQSATPLVVAVGRLVPVKDFPRLVRVMAGGAPEGARRWSSSSSARATTRPDIEEVVRRVGGADWVHLPGRVSDDELPRPLPPGLDGGLHLHPRGVGHDAHRGRRLRHADGGHRHRRARRRGGRGAQRPAPHHRRGPGRRHHLGGHRRHGAGATSRPGPWPGPPS